MQIHECKTNQVIKVVKVKGDCTTRTETQSVNSAQSADEPVLIEQFRKYRSSTKLDWR